MELLNAPADQDSLFPLPLRTLIENLHAEFEPKRQALLEARQDRQMFYDRGGVPTFLKSTLAKQSAWKVAPIPEDLLERRVEITGPISSAKMVIKMLSETDDGEIASTAMLDFEDSMAPTWENVLSGLRNVIGVARQTLEVVENGKVYRLDPKRMAHPMVRVRGLHLDETHILVHGQAVSAGLIDLAATAYHTARLFLAQGKTPKFYVPKCEDYLEARWWNEIFQRIEKRLGLSQGCLKVTFLIETLPAAFQMEEILFEIRERACGLNGGRWDKIFSDIKTLKLHADRVLADRSSIDMTRPWMDAYSKLLIKTCHKHGAFAMGGMSAFTPGKDQATREVQIQKVLADKKREATNGHDGCWVSHPFFIGPAKAQFTKRNQLDVLLADFPETPDLLPQPDGPKTLKGLRQNLRVGIVYQAGWNQGIGCVAYENLMEDLATLEISRAQVWQWLHHGVRLDDGTEVTRDLIATLLNEELETVLKELANSNEDRARFAQAKTQVERVFLAPTLVDFFPQFETHFTEKEQAHGNNGHASSRSRIGNSFGNAVENGSTLEGYRA